MQQQSSIEIYATIIFFVMVGLVIAAIGALAGGFFIMIGFGMIHGDIPEVPALGFWACWAINLLLIMLVRVIKTKVE